MISNDQPLVSVLMTSYNREKYIAEAIESVIASTYQNWELIIVDDCSKDRTVEIARSFELKDSRIKVYLNEQNIGQFPNRNLSVEYANGKYIKFLDSDDYIYPYGLEQLIFYIEQFPDAGYGLCSIAQDNSRIYPYILSPKEAYYRNYFIKTIFNKAPLSSIIKREAYIAIGGCTHHEISGDFHLWNMLSQKHSVVLMPQGIVWYREHADGEMEKARQSSLLTYEYLDIEKKILENPLCPLPEDLKQKAIKKAERKQSRFILHQFKINQFKTALELKKASKYNYYQLLLKGLY